MPSREKREYPLLGFGETLRKAREAKGLLQKEVADSIGVKKGIISMWEREKNWPGDANLRLVCALLDLEAPLPERNAKGRRSQGRSNCLRCGKSFPVFHDEKYCSRACAYAAMSERPSYNWKGGKKVTTAGYIQVYRPEHPAADKGGYIWEHRLVMEEMMGRLLESHEHVHHKNADRADNRPENLELWSNGHSGSHRGARVSDLIMDELRDEIRRIVREELAAMGLIKE